MKSRTPSSAVVLAVAYALGPRTDQEAHSGKKTAIIGGVAAGVVAGVASAPSGFRSC